MRNRFLNWFHHDRLSICGAILLTEGRQHLKWPMYPASCPSEIFVCSANWTTWATFWTSVIIMHKNVCIISVSCTLLFLGGYFCSVFSQKLCILCFRSQSLGRQDIQEIPELSHWLQQDCKYRGKLGKSGQGQSKKLTALQKWKHERYSFLAPFYKRGQKALKQSKTNVVLGGLPPSTDGESEEAPDAPDDGKDSSSSNTRKELPEPFSASLTSPPAIWRTKKRTRDKDEKASPDQKAAHYSDLMTVMKESTSHLVRSSSATHDREQDSFFTWLNDFTLRMPRTNWRQFQQRTVALAMEFTPAESPQANTARPRVEPEQQQQHTVYPPPRPVGPVGTTFIDLL